MVVKGEVYKTFRDNLNRFIAQKDVSQQDLARYMQVNPSTVSQWMCGKKIPRVRRFDQLCAFFNVTREDLLNPPGSASTKRLSPREKQLLEDFRKLSPNNQDVVESVVKALLPVQPVRGSVSNAAK